MISPVAPLVGSHWAAIVSALALLASSLNAIVIGSLPDKR